MAVKTWNGATAAIGTVADWSPTGGLSAGDVGVVSSGTVLANGMALDGMTLLLRSSTLGVVPALQLTGTTLGPNMRLGVQSAAGAASPTNARINVAGTTTNSGQLTVGTATTPASLTVQLAAPDTQLMNTGTIAVQSGSTASIGSGQVVNSGRITVAGGTLNLNSQLTGNGSIVIARDAAGQGGTVVANMNVGSGQSVLMHGGTLELGSPHFFLATLKGWDSGTTLELLHTEITAATFTGGVLSLYDGALTEAQILVGGSYTSADFHFSETAGGNALITTTHVGAFS